MRETAVPGAATGLLRARGHSWPTGGRRLLTAPGAWWPATVVAAVVLVVVGFGGVLQSGPRSGSTGLAVSGAQVLPLGARAAVSDALGRDEPGYRVLGFRAANRAQQLELAFSSTGASIVSSAGHVELGLVGFGYANRLLPVASARPQVAANRVSYVRGDGLREWYENGPLGLEQGFEIGSRPRAGVGHGPLTIALRVGGSLRARLGRGGEAVDFLTRGGRVALQYAGLSAFDARGRPLRAWLAVGAGTLAIRVDDRGARYPLRIDPFVQQGSKLTDSNAVEANQGISVALAADGNTALVGADNYNGNAGITFVFVRSGTTWSQQATLVGNDAVDPAYEGVSVALSADGNTALVGGWYDNGGAGAAWVFTRVGTTWTQQGSKLVGADASGNANQGFGVALSSDGNTALVGGPADDSSNGAAWVFVRSGTIWSQQGSKLVGAGTGGLLEQGYSVALSGDGTTALVGSPKDSADAGGAWVYTRSGTTWSQQGSELFGTGSALDSPFQGYSVALSGDGNTALVGGESSGVATDSAWVFARSGSTWSQQGAPLIAAPVQNFSEDHGVALSGDGNTALVGDPGDSGSVGGTWVFTRSGGAWSQSGSEIVGTGASGGAQQGWSVALSADGSTALAGGPYDSSGTGAAWVFTTGAQSSPTLTVARAGGGSGTVASADGEINCGSACAHTYPNGTSVTLTATPAAGSTFAGWSGGGCLGTGACQLTLSSDEDVTATFNANGPIVTTTSLTSSPDPSIAGQIVTYTATVSPISGSAAPTGGEVVFADGGTSIPGCDAAPLSHASGTAAHASCQTRYLDAGFHSIQATYSGAGTGPGSFTGSHSETLREVVQDPVTLTGNPTSGGTGVIITTFCTAPFACQVTDTLASFLETAGGEPVAVSAAHAKRKHHTVVVGTRRLTIQPHHKVKVTVELNATGRKLLTRFGKLPVRLTVSVTHNGKGITVATRKVTIKPKTRTRHKK